jgi:hypothetical protein
MKFSLEWKPVIQLLDLGEYNQAFAGESIPVCVNPTQETLSERTALIGEFSQRFAVYQKVLNAQEKPENAVEQVQEFNTWAREVFTPGVDAWFARLFSHNGETYTAEEIAHFGRVDAHFYNWIMRRAIEMIDEHRSGRKKNSATR